MSHSTAKRQFDPNRNTGQTNARAGIDTALIALCETVNAQSELKVAAHALVDGLYELDRDLARCAIYAYVPSDRKLKPLGLSQATKCRGLFQAPLTLIKNAWRDMRRASLHIPYGPGPDTL